MPFVLLILVNFVLFFRPTEVVRGWEDLPIYSAVILAALATTVRSVLLELHVIRLGLNPIGVCVVGLLGSVFLSHLTGGMVLPAIDSGLQFLKLVLYFLLLVAILRTATRLKSFLAWICAFMTIQAGFAVLQFFGYVQIEAFEPFIQREFDHATGEVIETRARLCGAGIFHDPNDLCVLLVIGVLLATWLLFDRSYGFIRFLWAIPLGVFLLAVPLTHSRGGMLALCGGLGTLAIVRLGAKRGALLLTLIAPLLLIVFGGRMTRFELDNSNDTSQHRMRHWSDGLIAVRSSPLFGIGQGRYEEIAGAVAHNSYIEGYTELGLLGGTLFTGAFVYAAWTMFRIGRRMHCNCAPDLAGLHPYLFAILVSMMVGLFSLSRNYSLPTYLVLGLMASYIRLASPYAPGAVSRLGTRLAVQGIAFSMVFFMFLSIGTGLFVVRQ